MKYILSVLISIFTTQLYSQKILLKSINLNAGSIVENKNALTQEFWLEKFPEFSFVADDFNSNNVTNISVGSFYDIGVGFKLAGNSHWLFTLGASYLDNSQLYNSYSKYESVIIDEYEYLGKIYEVNSVIDSRFILNSDFRRLGISLKSVYDFYPDQNITPYVGLGLNLAFTLESKLNASLLESEYLTLTNENQSMIFSNYLIPYFSDNVSLGFSPVTYIFLPIGFTWGFGNRKLIAINTEISPFCNIYQIRNEGTKTSYGLFTSVGLVFNIFNNDKPLIKGTR